MINLEKKSMNNDWLFQCALGVEYFDTYGLLSHDVATAKLRLTFSIARLSNALDV